MTQRPVELHVSLPHYFFSPLPEQMLKERGEELIWQGIALRTLERIGRLPDSYIPPKSRWPQE